MKLRKLLAQLGLAAVLLTTLNLPLSTAHAQGTAFTYQGRLDLAGTPANGTNDLTFTLYNAVSAGATVGTSNTFNDLVITNGLFTVTLDFGAGAFDGNARWVQIAARPGVSVGAYTNLAPRQAITPSPYAIFAGGASAAGVTGTLPAAALTGVSGSGLTSLNASNLTSGTVADTRLSANVALRTGGNTFNGTQAITNGFVGIGTATPLFPLQVRAGVNQNLVVEPGSTVGFSGAVSIRGVNDANTLNIPVALFGTPISLLGTTVGIGTTSPVAWLDVRGAGVGGIALGDYNITSSRYIGIIRPGDPANIAAGSGFSGVEFGGPSNNLASGFVAFHTHSFGGGAGAAAERMRIDKTGNVGIGTTTPNASLQVVTVNNYPTPGLSLAGSVPELMLSLQNTSANGRNWALLSSGTGSALPGALRFFDSTAGVDRMVLNSAGNVGLGTFAPRGKLDVNGDAYVNGHLLVKETAVINGLGRLHIQSGTSNGLSGIYLNPFPGGGDVFLGGVANPTVNLTVGGEVTCVAVNITSDRNAKEQFKPVSAREVLAKVAALPITEWQYKTQGDARHIGPMAQDFHAAFGTGRDDKHITSVDADGVALAAIQGLHEIVKEKSAEVESLKQSVAELRELVNRLAQPAGR